MNRYRETCNLDLIRQLQKIYWLATRFYPHPRGKNDPLDPHLLETLNTIANLAFKTVGNYEGDVE